MPAACMSKSYAFVYVLSGLYSYSGSNYVESLEPSCGYLAMTPLDAWDTMLPRNASLQNVSYANTIKFMRNGFAVRFPFTYGLSIKGCLAESIE